MTHRRYMRAFGALTPLLVLGLSGCFDPPEDDEYTQVPSGDVLGEPGKVTHQVLEFRWDAREFEDGEQILSTTRPLRVVVPGDARSVVVTINQPGHMPVLAEVALNDTPVFTLFDDRPTLSRGVFAWEHVVSAILPSNERSAPGNKRLDIFPAVFGGDFSSKATIDFVTNRLPAPQGNGRFDVNVIRVGDNHPSNDEIKRTLEVVNGVFREGGAPQINEYVIEQDSSGPQTVVVGNSDFLTLVATEPAKKHAVNIVLVDELLLDGMDDDLMLLGIAGGIPATPFHGTYGSALVISVDSHRLSDGRLLINEMGATIAHELGHMFGLFHTTEQAGTEHDPIADTLECSIAYDLNQNGRVDYEECVGHGAENLMFWGADTSSPSYISATQASILRNHPYVY